MLVKEFFDTLKNCKKISQTTGGNKMQVTLSNGLIAALSVKHYHNPKYPPGKKLEFEIGQGMKAKLYNDSTKVTLTLTNSFYPWNSMEYEGWSHCYVKDIFNKEVGRKLAMNYILEQLEGLSKEDRKLLWSKILPKRVKV